MENVTILFSGLVVGIIVFHTAIIAPTVFRSLTLDDAGTFLRTVFPKFFLNSYAHFPSIKLSGLAK